MRDDDNVGFSVEFEDSACVCIRLDHPKDKEQYIKGAIF